MTAAQLLCAGLMDALIGDPRWFPHPVRLMGRMVTWYERWVGRRTLTAPLQRVMGIVLALGLPVLVYFFTWLVIDWATRRDEILSSILVVLLAWTTLAARDLFDHALPVLHALDTADLPSARQAVSAIVGRDTERLSEPEIVRATVETLAESTADGIVAPLFYLVVGGPALALAFKAVSTLDSMVGHLDEHHRHLGWASARLDDLANWLPARLTGLLFVISAAVSRQHPAQAWKVFRRDASKHQSPNSGRPEAAMAGALGVQLGGPSTYGGTRIERPRLGCPHVPLAPARIREALRLVAVTSVLALSLALGLTVR